MRIRSLAAAAVAAPFLLTTMAAGTVPDGCYVADEGDTAVDGDEVIACEKEVWFHASTTKVSNLAGAGAQPVVTWDETAPSASVTAGAGGGFASTSVGRTAGPEATAFRAAGTFTGPIEAIDLNLHAIAPTSAAYTLDDLSVEVKIDGVAVHQAGTQLIVNPARPAPNASSPATIQFDFAFTNIDEFMELARLDLGADAEHTVEITVLPWFVDSGNWAWVFDTTEVPSSIVFNPVEIDAASSVHPVL